MSFYAEEIEIPAWRSYGDVSAFCMDAPARFAELRAVENVTKTLNEIRNDRSRFPIKKRGAYSEVTKWVQDTVTDDREYALSELSDIARVSVELRLYHAEDSGLEIRTLVHTGELGTGHIIWNQVVVRLGEDEYLWWSHD